MEQWESLIEACPSPVDLRYCHKAIQAASVALKEDLAHFEIEWILYTLLHQPVDLLSIISSKRADDAWFKVIGDSFKLLADAADRHREQMESHFERIVELCVLGYDAQTRKYALDCLSSIARVSPAGAVHARRLVASLEESATAKAPLALLIGTICEYHPETVENDINRIWRIYLNLLDSNKNSDQLTSALLRGILGLLKHFGCDLPTAELSVFYDKLAEQYIRAPRCGEVCLKILSEHSGLFRERISADARLRGWLWDALAVEPRGDAARSLLAVYEAVAACATVEHLQHIATTELVPQTQSSRARVKYCALRALAQLCARGVDVDLRAHSTAHALQFQLRQSHLSDDVAEAVSWCLESAQTGSETLLQAAMMFYTHLPAKSRKKAVAHAVLNANDALRTTAVIFLISESTQSETSLELHLPLWKDLFDSDSGKDATVLDKSTYVFEDFMSYVVFVLEEFLEQGIDVPPARLCLLLRLTALLLALTSPDAHTNDHCLMLLPLVTQLFRLRPLAETLSAGRRACAHVTDPSAHEHDLRQFYQAIRIDRCKDEALLCESCLALVEAPCGATAADVLLALQITFSRNDAEPNLLSKALLKLENVMNLEKENLDSNILNDIQHNVGKIQNRKDLSGKDARILRRDVLMFIGKYGREPKIDFNNLETTVIVKLMDTLTLNVPSPDEGTAYKINLQKILHQALEHEDSNSLQIILTILCANLSGRRATTAQAALFVVCRALCREHTRGSNPDPRGMQLAVTLCNSGECVQGMMQCIGEEKSPGVRKMLSDALEALLAREGQDDLISAVADHAAAMMTSSQSTNKRAGLNITETLILSLKEYNILTKNLLPELLVLISKTFEIDSDTTFEAGSKLFLEKIELFNSNEVEKLIKDLLEAILIENILQNTPHKMAEEGVNNKMAETEVRIFKITTKMILDFIKCVIDYKKEDKKKIWSMIFEIFNTENYNLEKSLYVLATFKSIFGHVTDIERDFLNKFISIEVQMEEPYFCMEAVLMFLQEYNDTLLELYSQETLQFLSKCITELTPQCIKYLHRIIKSCMSVYTNKRTPAILQRSFEAWCSNLPILAITNSIEKESFIKEHSIIVFALRIMLRFLDITTLTDVSNVVKKWPKILLKLFSNGHIVSYFKSKMSYLRDILSVSIRFLKVAEVKKLILEGSNMDGLTSEKVGVQFCRFFMHVFYDILVKKPFTLLDAEMDKCCILLNDIVKFTVKKKCSDDLYDTVLELVDKFWPVYELQTTFTQKHLLLLELNNFSRKLGPDSNPLRWAVNNIIYSEAGSEDKAMLIGVLPGGEDYSEAYRSFASLLPTRLSEMRGAALSSLRALLDALAATRDLVLMDIVITLASGEESSGWWDEALSACMATVALSGDMALCRNAFLRATSPVACRRVLLPLLRYSTPKFNEEFFSTILVELLKPREKNVAPTHRIHHRNILEYTRLFNILQVACEKIPETSLESPNSALYRDIVPKLSQSWYLIKEVCKMCNKLKRKPIPEGADSKFKEDFRQFQCANYNCFVAAICRRRPEAKFYTNLFDPETWDLLIDKDKKYTLWIRHQWKQRSTMVLPGVGAGQSRSASGSARSVRSRLFLRTLSESPLMYDLIQHAEDEEETATQEISVPLSEVNSHECASSLTTLVAHAATLLPPPAWLPPLSAALQRAPWLLAQVICNCKEELRSHANALRAPLLEMVASTAVKNDGLEVLNGLHMDILEMILDWGDENPPPSEALDSALKLLLATGIHHSSRKSIFLTITNLASRFLDQYGAVVNVPVDFYEPYLKVNDTPKSLLIHIPTVLPTLMAKLEAKQFYQLSKIAEVIGLALNKSREKQQNLIKFRKVLEAVRRSHGSEYIRTLCYASTGCPDCCDEYHFRMATNLAQKLVGEDRNKCLRVLSTYASSFSNESVQEMFETVDLSELMACGCEEAFLLVAKGLGALPGRARRSLVTVAIAYIDHSEVGVRKAVAAVVLKAFEELLETSEEPATKRRREWPSPIAACTHSSDVYTSAVTRALARTVTDSNKDVSGLAREGLARFLHSTMGIRFIECFLLAVYVPVMSNSRLAGSVTALLDLFFLKLKSQDRFRNVLLRDEALDVRLESAASSKLLTLSRTYQGSFRRADFTSRRRPVQLIETDQNNPEIDVQISIEHILDTFMRFAKEVPQVSEVLCLEIIRALQPSGLGADLATALAAILDVGVNELTPFIAEVCTIFVDDLCKVDGIQNTIKKLEQATRNSEGEGIIRSLSQEVLLRIAGREQFELGTETHELGTETHEPVVGGTEDDAPFSIEGLTSVFGMLSNWDCLTIQQKDRLRSSLPALWTDYDMFRQQLDSYTGSEGWFGRMAAARRGSGRADALRWLREVQRWPATRLHIGAITEAVAMLECREEAVRFPTDIRPTDCLAEWAARLMIRTSYQTSIMSSDSSEDRSVLCRSHELKWCEVANEMGLGAAVLKCVKRNTPSLSTPSEPSSWLRVALTARGGAGGAARQLVQLASRDLAALRLVMMLHRDNNSLSQENIQEAFNAVESIGQEASLDRNKQALRSICELAMSHYALLWDTEGTESQQNELVSSMTDILARGSNLGQFDEDLLAVILSRLDQCSGKLEDAVANKLVQLINLNLSSVDDLTIDYCVSVGLFPTRPPGCPRVDAANEKYKKCLQLLCDPEYCLLQYCSELRKALLAMDEDKWESTFRSMKEKLFENPYAGPDYQLLNRYKDKLYAISEYEPGAAWRNETERVLKEAGRALSGRAPRSRLHTPQLCPALARANDCPPALLGLPNGVIAQAVLPQVSVLTSIRRPVLTGVRCSDGRVRRFLVKSGEPARADAAAARVQASAKRRGAKLTTYKVTPLSEDCGLIEFLEDHETLRALIGADILDAALESVSRSDEDLAQSSTAALAQYNQLCSRVPAQLLRRALARRALTVPQRLMQEKQFTDTLAATTIITWILGVSDRHLENTLCGRCGRLAGVDWAGVLTGPSPREPPPARLTRNLLAITSHTVLEARLQQLLTSLRESHQIFSAVIKVSFKWMEERFELQFPHIKSMLNGTALPSEWVRAMLQQSSAPGAEKVLRLLEPYPTADRETYAVQEQISCLLRLCTDPRLLSVTRSDWEPWV